MLGKVNWAPSVYILSTDLTAPAILGGVHGCMVQWMWSHEYMLEGLGFIQMLEKQERADIREPRLGAASF